MVKTNELKIGPDTVEVYEGALTILAAREMQDWNIREFCRLPIYFQNRKYYVLKKSPAPAPHALRYDLALWTPDLPQEGTRFIIYDEDYVVQREREFQAGRKHDHLHSVLMAVYPLLGFCWSGFKQRVLSPIGFDPVAITTASIMFSFAFFMLEAIFVFYFHYGFLATVVRRILFVPTLWIDYFIFLTLPLDCLVRFGRILGGDSNPPGYLEWVFDRWRKK